MCRTLLGAWLQLRSSGNAFLYGEAIDAGLQLIQQLRASTGATSATTTSSRQHAFPPDAQAAVVAFLGARGRRAREENTRDVR